METKQVIVMRRDLKMRKGKIGAQAAHAAMAFLTRNAEFDKLGKDWPYSIQCDIQDHDEEVKAWIESSFRKIVLYVDSEQELDELHQKALDNGLVSHMVIDNGLTEFNGVHTKTCLAIGPHEDGRFIGVTDHLPLY